MADIEVTPLPVKLGSDQHRWRLDDRGDRVELTPLFPVGFVATCWGMGVFLYLWGTVIFKFAEADWVLWFVWNFGIPLFMIVVVPLAYLGYRFGPRFIVDRVTQTLTFPAIDKSWQLTEVLGWQIIETSGPTDRNAEHRSQLVLVLSHQRIISRHLLCAGIGLGMPDRFRQLAKEIELLTGLGLVSDVKDGVEQLRG